MKKINFYLLITMLTLMFFLGCRVSFFIAFNGRTGSLFVRITDSKPALPHGTEAVYITFEEFLIHQKSGEWIFLPLSRIPYTINLLEFHSGKTTPLIVPVDIEPGTYDRIGVVISSALVQSDGTFYSVNLPSGTLRTERELIVKLEEGETLDLTIDFDLSQSLAVSGPQQTPSYQLKPVLHINPTEEAAAIQGEIAAGTFEEYESGEAIVTVFIDKDLSGDLSGGDEEYTRVVVDRDNGTFKLFWLVPEQGYVVQMEMDGAKPPEFEQFVYPADLQKGDTFHLNQSYPI
jgi:hypothetical protein